MTVWNETTYYFKVASATYRKIFLVLKHFCREQSLAAHYLKMHGHIVPAGIELRKYDLNSSSAERLREIGAGELLAAVAQNYRKIGLTCRSAIAPPPSGLETNAQINRFDLTPLCNPLCSESVPCGTYVQTVLK